MVQRIVGRLVLVMGLVLASVLFSGSTASAGGPTSVLLSVPSADRITALRYSHPSYSRLDVLLHNGTPLPEQFADGTTQVTATWLIHDVQVWRIDRIYLDAPGGPVVGTQEVGFGETFSAEPTISWRRINDGAQIRTMLTEVGVLGTTPPMVPTPAANTPVQPAAVPSPAEGDTGGAWWWGAAGLIGGAGATFLVTRRRQPTAAAEDDEPALVVQDGR